MSYVPKCILLLNFIFITIVDELPKSWSGLTNELLQSDLGAACMFVY